MTPADAGPAPPAMLREPLSRWVINFSWLLLLVSLSLYSYLSLRATHPTLLELSYYPVLLAVGLQIKTFLNDRAPRTFRELRDSQALSEAEWSASAERLSRRLNHPLSVAVAGAVGLSIVAFYFPAVRQIHGARFDLALAFVGIAAIDVLLAYAVGMAAWKATVSALELRRLGNQDRLLIRPFHPDGCGGLLPIGRFCLSLSLILVVLTFFFVGWIAYYRLLLRKVPDVYRTVEPWLVGSLIATVTLSVLAFFLPMLSIHRVMRAEAAKALRPLGQLAGQISREEEALLPELARLPDPELTKAEAHISLLRNHYAQRRRIPTWPIDLRIQVQFLGAQLTLWLGIVTTMISLLKTTLASLLK
jgi:hypothetical protein